MSLSFAVINENIFSSKSASASHNRNCISIGKIRYNDAKNWIIEAINYPKYYMILSNYSYLFRTKIDIHRNNLSIQYNRINFTCFSYFFQETKNNIQCKIFWIQDKLLLNFSSFLILSPPQHTNLIFEKFCSLYVCSLKSFWERY